jgi:hypothetical protein
MKTAEINELDLVALREDLPVYGLRAGDVGTVVLVYRDGQAYEVEFVAANGRTIAVETLDAARIEPLNGERSLHVRKLAIS